MKKIKLYVELYGAIVNIHFDGIGLKKADRDLADYCVCRSDDTGTIINIPYEGVALHHVIQCLSHELNHASIDILHMRDIEVSFKHQEALCYLQDHLLGKVLKKMGIK